MTAPARPRPPRLPDVVGGLEVRRNRAGHWDIHLPDGTAIPGLMQPRRRNARAVRQLLLEAVPDWTRVTATEWPDDITAARRAAATRVIRMVSLVMTRISRGVCLGCGCREGMCACGTGCYPDGPHYTPAELEWTR